MLIIDCKMAAAILAFLTSCINETDLTTCWDGEDEQTAEPSGSQKSALPESPTVGQHEQDERASRNFNQPKYKLGEVEVRPEPGHT